MTEFNVSDHWSDNEPAWVKSLVSSLDRSHRASSVLPLTLIVDEVVNWVHLASGEDAWRKAQNRNSMTDDLNQAVAALGVNVATSIDVPLKKFVTAFNQLTGSPKAVQLQPSGSRTDPAWAGVLTAAADLLQHLDSDAAVGASWDDLLATAQDPTLKGREYRPIAELLYAQLGRRGLDADMVFRDLVQMVAYGSGPNDLPNDRSNVPVSARLSGARDIAIEPAETHHVVVWLGYLGRVDARLNIGRVTFYNAHWTVPNAHARGQYFDHRDELTHLVGSGNLFKVAEFVHEESDVDMLVRVDLGQTHHAGASDRAAEIVETIINASLHFGGGIRPFLVQYRVMGDGEFRSSSFMTSRRDTGFSNDHYGATMTADSIEQHGAQIADALARAELPRFLAAALQVQTTADHPFSRDFALREPSQADITSVVPLADRVVQHVAAHAAIAPAEAFDTVGSHWPHARWLGDVRYAAGVCLVGSGFRNELRDELSAEWHNPKGPWILFAADRKADLLSVCRVESERGWVTRMLDSISDYSMYSDLIDAYTDEGRILEARRKRVRNALVHGNPAHFDVVASVRSYSEFLSSGALHAGIESYVTSTDAATALGTRTAEYTAMNSGMDAATYWRSQV